MSAFAAGPLPEPDPALVARLEGIDLAFVATHEAEAAALARQLARARRHEFGVFSGWIGDVGGPWSVAILAAGGPGPERAWAAVQQLAFLCPNAAALLHVGLAGVAEPAAARRGEAFVASTTRLLRMPRVVLAADAPPERDGAAWDDDPAGRDEGGAPPRAHVQMPPAPASPPRAAPTAVIAAAARQLVARRPLVSTPSPIDTPLQRDWITRHLDAAAIPPDALFDREGAAAAAAAAQLGRSLALGRVVTDFLTILSPAGLASSERLDRPPLRHALETAAARFLGVARAWAERPTAPRTAPPPQAPAPPSPPSPADVPAAAHPRTDPA